MNDKNRRHRLFSASLLGLILALLVVGVTLAAGNISNTDKWAWGTNVGWINFNPSNGGVTVYADRLEGDAWGENIGWIRLKGTAQDSTAYGVNNDGCGNLSGYAWGTNIGWLNFAPANGGVWVDPVTGDFDGYAWGENVGWIHAKNTTGNAYKVTTTWRGALTAAYQNNIAAIIKDRAAGPASSNGLIVGNSAFLNQAGDCIIFGHNNATFRGGVTENLPGGVDKRWARIWQLDVKDQGGGGGNVTLTFDISEAGGTGSFSDTGAYFLLKRATGDTGNFSVVLGGYLERRRRPTDLHGGRQQPGLRIHPGRDCGFAHRGGGAESGCAQRRVRPSGCVSCRRHHAGSRWHAASGG